MYLAINRSLYRHSGLDAQAGDLFTRHGYPRRLAIARVGLMAIAPLACAHHREHPHCGCSNKTKRLTGSYLG